MSALPPHRRGQLTSMTVRDTARRTIADQAWAEAETEKRALDERTAQLRAARLAREKAKS
jgi:hypothetical protein